MLASVVGGRCSVVETSSQLGIAMHSRKMKVLTMNFRPSFLVFFAALSSFLAVGCAFSSKPKNGRPSSPASRSLPDSATDSEKCSLSSRRGFLSEVTIPIFAAVSLMVPDSALASPPVSKKETDSLLALAQRARRPKPPKVLRRKLSQDFAVLLMRASYDALDEIDCVAMDQFQRDFFLIRSSEYQPYVNNLGTGMVQQGVLTDPYYFDFISFAQYKTINREIKLDPSMIFEEQKGIEQDEDRPQKFVPVIIKRDPNLKNSMLGPEHNREVGELIVNRLEEIFGGTDSAIPKILRNSRPDANTLFASLKQLVNLFLINGFAFSGSVSIVSDNAATIDANGTKYSIRLTAPATLWGGQALQQEGATLLNDFVFKAARELCYRAGYGVSSSSITYAGSVEETVFTIR